MTFNWHVSHTLDDLKAEIARVERAIATKKEAANQLCSLLGRPPIYPVGLPPLANDAYYARPLAIVAGEVLSRRRASGLGAATVAEIYAAVVAGGYHFGAANDLYAMRGLYSVLAQPPFHKLPDGRYGLECWYPAIRRKRKLRPAASFDSERW